MDQQDNLTGISTQFLANNIRCLRKRQDLSQEELAALAGLNRGNIASYENGTAEPKICSLLKMADIFGVSILDLSSHDLTDEHIFEMANTTFRQRSIRDTSTIKSYESQIAEFQKVIEGLYTCHQFKCKSLGEDAPREVHAMAHKFEELHEIAAQLLERHQELIQFVKCRLEKNGNC
jgi:transcriptional regulator with XRE-family HTH domain